MQEESLLSRPSFGRPSSASWLCGFRIHRLRCLVGVSEWIRQHSQSARLNSERGFAWAHAPRDSDARCVVYCSHARLWRRDSRGSANGAVTESDGALQMLADGDELGEWGFAALVEVDGHRILFDTGMHTDVVLKNARTLNVDLTTVQELVLSHWHSDHTGGLLTLRSDLMKRVPSALSRAHVGEGFFLPRVGVPPGVEQNQMIRVKPEYEQMGGTFVVHAKAVQLFPGVWLTGPVPRKHPERNWSGRTQIKTPSGFAEDTV